MLFKYCWIKLLVVEILQSSNWIVCTDFLHQDNLVCYEYLVSGTKYNVPDEQLSASSQYDALHAAKWGRLNTVYVKGKHIGGWVANNTKPPHYIEVCFNELMIIQAIATQGRNITGDTGRKEHYVTKYHVYYRLDYTSPWAAVIGGRRQKLMVFQGNNDSNCIRINKLPCAVQARVVRIRVNESRKYPSMRFDVLGCPVSQVQLSPDCDFEDGFCGWKQEYDNKSVNWQIKNGATSPSKLLKLHDHTRKHEDGLFAYVMSISSSDGSRRNRTAQLVTMIRRSNIKRCLHLWYSGSYASFGLLTLYVIGCENESETYIAKHVRNLTQEWNHIYVDVSVKDYRLIIEGTVRSEDNGYLAIDDISLMKGSCSEREKDNKKTEVLVGVAVGVGVFGLLFLIVIGIYLGRQRTLRSSAATTTIKTELKMALSDEMYMNTVQEYANVMPGNSESVSPDPIYQEV
ncbi:hypothetical protein ACJMK2_025270 [Sinanodonta woodiana]|uniref:Uncharacterized protein n=1 Tax=Sinanodonta woodiana TaxID=1069815 RepID=A0ABD3XJT0_SINWO